MWQRTIDIPLPPRRRRGCAGSAASRGWTPPARIRETAAGRSSPPRPSRASTPILPARGSTAPPSAHRRSRRSMRCSGATGASRGPTLRPLPAASSARSTSRPAISWRPSIGRRASTRSARSSASASTTPHSSSTTRTTPPVSSPPASRQRSTRLRPWRPAAARRGTARSLRGCAHKACARPRRPACRHAPLAFEPGCAAYAADVERVKALILDGEVYQANLSRRLRAALPAGFDPFALYLRLRAVNPAPYAAFLEEPQRTVASASPELFLRFAMAMWRRGRSRGRSGARATRWPTGPPPRPFSPRRRTGPRTS